MVFSRCVHQEKYIWGLSYSGKVDIRSFFTHELIKSLFMQLYTRFRLYNKLLFLQNTPDRHT